MDIFVDLRLVNGVNKAYHHHIFKLVKQQNHVNQQEKVNNNSKKYLHLRRDIFNS
jgi:predicted nucleotidyltransferase